MKLTFSHTMDFQFFMYDYDFFTHIVNNEESYYHNHNFVEIFYILEGTCKHYINDTCELLNAGDLLFLRPNDTHCFIETEKYNCRRRDVLFSKALFENVCSFLHPDLYNNFLNANKQQKFKLSLSEMAKFENELNMLSFLVNKNKNSSTEAQIKIFCGDLVKHLLPPPELPIQNAPTWLLQLISTFNNGVEVSRSLSEILENYHYNATYIRKTFKQYTGMSMTDYRLNEQLKYALTLLKTTDLPVKDIAERAGFNNYPYFNKAFKEKYKITPLKARTSSSHIF